MFLRYRLQNAVPYLTRRRGWNVFHCCIQKTATQWFLNFFRRVVREPGVRMLVMPGMNYIPRSQGRDRELRGIPDGIVVSPLYIRPSDFMEIYGKRRFRAFFVFRDPRDIVVSDYFSLKNSHPIQNEYYREWRHRLSKVDAKEGLKLRIKNMDWNFYEPLAEWAEFSHPDFRRVRYEDFFGPRQAEEAAALLEFLKLPVRPERLAEILEELSFRRKSGGRAQGQTDAKSHYRKGEAGDWKNHFDDELKVLFKGETGSLLQSLGYESGTDW